MSIDVKCIFNLNAVIQIINEHNNKPIIKENPRIYSSCPVEIIRKENGMFAFVNAKEKKFNIKIDLPRYLSETAEIFSDFKNKVHIIRCSPNPMSILGVPDASTTYFEGKALPNERIYLQCPIGYCNINLNNVLDDGTALFESTNFLFAGMGRCLLLKDENGKCQLVHTEVSKEYPSNRLFVSDKPLKERNFSGNVTVLPVFSVRSDKNGKFLLAAEDAIDGTANVLDSNGRKIKSFEYQANKRIKIDYL